MEGVEGCVPGSISGFPVQPGGRSGGPRRYSVFMGRMLAAQGQATSGDLAEQSPRVRAGGMKNDGGVSSLLLGVFEDV